MIKEFFYSTIIKAIQTEQWSILGDVWLQN